MKRDSFVSFLSRINPGYDIPSPDEIKIGAYRLERLYFQSIASVLAAIALLLGVHALFLYADLEVYPTLSISVPIVSALVAVFWTSQDKDFTFLVSANTAIAVSIAVICYLLSAPLAGILLAALFLITQLIGGLSRDGKLIVAFLLYLPFPLQMLGDIALEVVYSWGLAGVIYVSSFFISRRGFLRKTAISGALLMVTLGVLNDDPIAELPPYVPLLFIGTVLVAELFTRDVAEASESELKLVLSKLALGVFALCAGAFISRQYELVVHPAYLAVPVIIVYGLAERIRSTRIDIVGIGFWALFFSALAVWIDPPFERVYRYELFGLSSFACFSAALFLINRQPIIKLFCLLLLSYVLISVVQSSSSSLWLQGAILGVGAGALFIILVSIKTLPITLAWWSESINPRSLVSLRRSVRIVARRLARLYFISGVLSFGQSVVDWLSHFREGEHSDAGFMCVGVHVAIALLLSSQLSLIFQSEGSAPWLQIAVYLGVWACYGSYLLCRGATLEDRLYRFAGYLMLIFPPMLILFSIEVRTVESFVSILLVPATMYLIVTSFISVKR